MNAHCNIHLNYDASCLACISALRNSVLEAAMNYYVKSEPTISDEEYDALFRELIAVEHKIADENDRITNKVRCGVQSNSSFEKVKHSIPMLSLDNAFSEENLLRWLLSNELELEEMFISPKLDGASLSLVYRNGKLQHALRRGDGKTGDDITISALEISGIPAIIPNTEAFVNIRGEVVCPTFETDFSDKYANHRNFVSGSLNLKSAKEVRTRKLQFIAYDNVIQEKKTYSEELDLLRSYGFMTVKMFDRNSQVIPYTDISFNTLAIFYDHIKNLVMIPIDGVVVRVNDNLKFHKLGVTSHHPRGAIACKFQTRSAVTTIIGVTWQVGKTGIVTPVAIFDPVELDGSTISRATLHNVFEIADLDVAINDTVEITKAGSIIPKIIKVVTRAHNRIPIRTSRCPSCHSKLVHDGAYLKCTNKECGDRRVQELLKSLDALDIKGFGKAIVTKLVDAGIVSLDQMLTVSYEQLLQVTKSELIAEKLIDELDNKLPTITFKQTLCALNIPFVSSATAQLLIDNNITQVKELSNEENLKGIKGIGPKKIAAISEFVSENSLKIRNLTNILPLEITLLDAISAEPSEVRSVVMTGKFPKSRKEMEKMLQAQGFHVQSTVNSKTDFLLTGKNPGADKVAKAKGMGINIIKFEDSEFNAVEN